jgi:glycosyltransferase involved in cell wall biosynthesis
MPPSRSSTDLLCFSQLRWDFVYQRPQHLMSRAARDRCVWFVEEPVFDHDAPRLIVEPREPGLSMIRPVVRPGSPEAEVDATVSLLLRQFAENRGIERPVAWYYTPMALPWTEWLEPALTVYDCMDELSAFRFAPARLRALEAKLLVKADVVFTGGQSLYAAKRDRNPNVHAFPSAVDAGHFRTARASAIESADQIGLPHPRIGWFGVIDERVDLGLVAAIADLRPSWSFVLIGPVVKIDPATLPARPNIYALGQRSYAELPSYVAGWDVAMMPFARNESTRFISPTKTLEYLAAGRPVVSTSIQDVVDPFERLGLVRIADSPDVFIEAIEAALSDDPAARIAAADAFLEHHSWDDTWAAMSALMDSTGSERVGGPMDWTAVVPAAVGSATSSALRRR